MDISVVTEAVVQYFSGTLGKLELIATVLLIINVYLIAQQDIRNFIFGAIGVAIFGYIFMEYKLYSDMGLQWLYYLPLQAIGYYWWRNKGPGLDDLPVSKLDAGGRLTWLLVIASASAGLGYAMKTFTDASLPYWDALTTVMSVVANYLLIKKIWENWAIWVVMDVIAIGVYYYKGLYVTSGLYVVFLGLATYGLFKWLSDYNKEHPSEATPQFGRA